MIISRRYIKLGKHSFECRIYFYGSKIIFYICRVCSKGASCWNIIKKWCIKSTKKGKYADNSSLSFIFQTLIHLDIWFWFWFCFKFQLFSICTPYIIVEGDCSLSSFHPTIMFLTSHSLLEAHLLSHVSFWNFKNDNRLWIPWLY